MRTPKTSDRNKSASSLPETKEPAIQGSIQTSNRKFMFASFAIAAAIFLAVYLLRLDRIVGLFVDDAWYALLAKSLATGQGYQLINSPSPGILPVYPPVYPFLMSLAYRLWPSFPDNLILLKMVSILAMLMVGWGSYKHFNRDREWPHLLSLVCALTVTLMPGLVFLATSSTMSECVFTAFQLLAVVAIEAAVRAKDGKTELRNAALGGALAATAFLTRSIGLAVIGAGFLYLVKERKWRSVAVFSVAVVIFAAPWVIYSRTHKPTIEQRTEQGGMIVQDYSEQFWQARAGDTSSAIIHWESLPDRMWSNAMKIAGNNLAMIFAPTFHRSTKLSGEETLESGLKSHGLSYFLSVLLLLGFALTVKRRLAAAELTTAFTILITCAWPWDTFRFLLPLTPFLLAYLLESVRGIREFMRIKFETKTSAEPWRAMTILAGILLVFFIYDHSAYLAKRSDLTRAEYLPWQAIFNENLEALKWIKEKTPEDAAVCSMNPALVYLYTGRKSVASNNADGNWENWKRLNVRYMAYISVFTIADPGLDEGRFDQAYRSKGPLKIRVMDLGRKESRLPWKSFNPAGGSIKIDNLN
ncbi:MAG TPA: glycosyltransferase family 39 protein [Blastocatellia bacterium]|nr:glycosyltransferase family 39 protein [Blastocatellia bacterium]